MLKLLKKLYPGKTCILFTSSSTNEEHNNYDQQYAKNISSFSNIKMNIPYFLLTLTDANL